MMGVGLLYHLAEEGWKDVVLVEKGELTSGSTWHAAGQCPSFIGDYTMAMVHHYSNTLYPKLEELTGQYISWHGCGGIRLATFQAELEWFKHVADVAKNIGYRMEVIGPDEIRRINPFIDTTGVIAGAWTLDDGHVDPAGTCNAMAIGARNMGASIIRHNRVTDINQRPSGEWEVVTEKGTIIAEHVVNAAGSYARMVSQMVGSDAPIFNTEHQYFITEPIPEFFLLPAGTEVRIDRYLRDGRRRGGLEEGEQLSGMGFRKRAVRSRFRPGAPPLRARLRANATLGRCGYPTGRQRIHSAHAG
jgi:dimethylglycine dehydrogenase